MSSGVKPKSVVLTKGHERSQEERESIRDIHDGAHLSNRQIGQLFPRGGITGEAVRLILGKTGPSTPYRQRPEVGRWMSIFHTIVEDETILSFGGAARKYNFEKRHFKNFLKGIGRFRELINLFDERVKKDRQQKARARRNRTILELQQWAVKLGCNPPMHILVRVDPGLHARIERNGGPAKYRDMAGLKGKGGDPLPPGFAEMMCGRIEFK